MSSTCSVSSRVRVLVVDDSAFMRNALSRMISSDDGLEVAGIATSGSDALEKIPSLNPDVITLDVEMPGLDGLATLRHIMRRFPRPVIMVSSFTEQGAETTFDALNAGAFDYVPKHMASTSLEIAHIRSDLVSKIHAAAESRMIRRAQNPLSSTTIEHLPDDVTAPAVVAIAASTGGPNALQEILPRFPADFGVPILIVQHMPAGFTTSFAQRLNGLCAIGVREASQHEIVQPGIAYICPAGVHMRVQRQLSDFRIILDLSPDPCNALHIPSADILMESVAEVYRCCGLGVILTGMGSDGAHGMKAIYREGGFTIGQDAATSAVYGMPKACAEMGILKRIVPLPDIPTLILQATRRHKAPASNLHQPAEFHEALREPSSGAHRS
jgi:two-component system chemotaxis response regulator CheB